MPLVLPLLLSLFPKYFVMQTGMVALWCWHMEEEGPSQDYGLKVWQWNDSMSFFRAFRKTGDPNTACHILLHKSTTYVLDRGRYFISESCGGKRCSRPDPTFLPTNICPGLCDFCNPLESNTVAWYNQMTNAAERPYLYLKSLCFFKTFH